MTIRFYLMPLIGTGTRRDPRRPAYRETDLAGEGFALDYGAEPVCLVRVDASDTQHTAVTAHSDVFAFPLPLTSTIGAALTSTQASLETFHIPNDWLTSTHTWRQLLRVIGTIFQFAQRLHRFRAGRIFPAGVTLATPFQDLPAATRQAITAAAEEMAFDTSWLTGLSTMRQILKAFGDAFSGTIRMGTDTLT
jgi:hypothetical protein